MSFSIPSARYADKADGISENARSLWSGRETTKNKTKLDSRLRGNDRWADSYAVRNAVD
jgi:hypothetical protein